MTDTDEILDELVAKGVSGKVILLVGKALEALDRQAALRRKAAKRQEEYAHKKQAAE